MRAVDVDELRAERRLWSEESLFTRTELARRLWAIARHIPCALCKFKGGWNIEPDGGCRHCPAPNDPHEEVCVYEAITRF